MCMVHTYVVMLCDMCSIDIRDGVVSAVHVSCVYRMCVLHTPIQYVCLVCVWSKCIDVFGMCVCVIVHVCCVVDTVLHIIVGALYFLLFSFCDGQLNCKSVLGYCCYLETIYMIFVNWHSDQ